MRTETIQIFKFSELSDAAKQKALNWARGAENDQPYYYELIQSVKELADRFNLKINRQYDDLRSSHIDDCILNLRGVRLYKWLINNHYSNLFKPKYIKTFDRKLTGRQFIFNLSKGEHYTSVYSKLNWTNECVLTGVCYDNDILAPLYDFLKNPEHNVTLEDLFGEVNSAISKAFRDIEDWINSDEFLTDFIEANEYEFTEDGDRY